MRKFFATLCYSFLLCLASFGGAHASAPAPDRKVYATEYAMHAPTMATCVTDTVATTYAAILKPAPGPVAPASLVAVDGGTEYLALIRAMTCPADRQRKLVSSLRSIDKENEKPRIDPGR